MDRNKKICGGNKKKITNKEFIDKFVECLKEGRTFELKDCIVNGDVGISKIYEIIKDNEKLKELIEEKDNTIYVKININIDIENVEFNGKFIMKGTFYIHGNRIASFKYIRTIFDGNVKFNNVKFNKEAYFKDVIFSRRVDFRNSKFNAKAIFTNAIFNKYLEGLDSGFTGSYYTNFLGVMFNNSCNFDNAIFYGNVEFSTIFIEKSQKQTKFLGNTSFNGVKFFGEVEFCAVFGKEEDKDTFKNVDFRGAEFHKKTSFNHSEFNIKVFFDECRFNGKTYFQFMELKNYVHFDKAIFNERVEFRCPFKSSVSFSGTKFNVRVNFTNMKFNGVVYFTKKVEETKTKVEKTEFKNVVFDGVEFKESIVFDEAIFHEAIGFFNSKFYENVYFKYCEFKGMFVCADKSLFFEIKDEAPKTIFYKDITFSACTFNSLIKFDEVEFKGETIFLQNTFNKDIEFIKTIFNKSIFRKSIFKSITKFGDISFNLLAYSECIFEYISHFKSKKDNNGFAVFYKCAFGHKEVIIENFPLPKTSFLKTDVRDVLILCDVGNSKILSHELLHLKECLLLDDIDNELSKIYSGECKDYTNLYLKIQKLFSEIGNEKPYDFTIKIMTWTLPKLKMPLKRTAFILIFTMSIIFSIFIPILMYSIFKSIMLNIVTSVFFTYIFTHTFLYILFSPYLKISKSPIIFNKLNKKSYLTIYTIVEEDLNYKSVLAEYRNLRISIENNRTYIEASELFKKEMELIKEKSGLFEKIIVWFYGILSDYGESILKPFIWSLGFILLFPAIALYFNYYYILIIFDLSKVFNFYFKCVSETLRAFFQLGIKNDKSLMYNYEWLIRIISLILLGNLFIAIKRRLERK